MSYKIICSYWGKISGGTEKDRREAANLFLEEEALEMYDTSDDTIDICVAEGVGAIDQWNRMDEVIVAVSKQFPSLTITMNEKCEEPWTPEREIIATGGAIVSDQCGRQVEPGEIDEPTAEKCIEVLEAAGMKAAADAIRKELL